MNSQPVAIKVLKPHVEKSKILRFIKVSEALKGGPNILELIDVVKDPETNDPVLIIELLEHDEIQKIKKSFNYKDIRHYMYQILQTLDYAHSKGIFHRDMKLINMAFEHSKRKVTILDWGLADFYHPNQEYFDNDVPRARKSPEVMLKYSF